MRISATRTGPSCETATPPDATTTPSAIAAAASSKTIASAEALRLLLERGSSEVGVDADLERSRAKLLQALRLRSAVSVKRRAGEHRTVPQAQRLARSARGLFGIAGGKRIRRLIYERLEDPRVERRRAEIQPIAAAATLERDPVWCEHASEPRDVCLEAVANGRRWLLAPDIVDQAVVRHHLAGTKEKSSENGPLLATAELDLGFPCLGLERAEDAQHEWR